MTTISIPPAALDAGKRELYPHLLTESDDMVREIARAAFVAMVEAWPGMDYQQGALVTAKYRDPGKIILPLTEKQDDKA